MEPFPPIPDILIDRLDAAFPFREDFGPTTSHVAMVHHYGQRSVIRFLRDQQALQNETILNKE